jgi:hypothetical protein
MERSGLIRLLVFVGLVWPTLSLPPTIGAQDGTPTTAVDLATGLGFPLGIRLTRFGEVIADNLPARPAMLRVEREGLAPGQQTEMRQTRSLELTVVLAGEVVVVDNLGFRVTAKEGSEFLLHAGFGYQLSNEGSAPVSILRLAITIDAATPGAASDTEQDDASGPEILVEEEVQLPSPSATLFVGRMSWDPATTTDRYWQAGILGFIPESGELTLSLHSPSGLTRERPLRRPYLIPANTLHEEVNRDSDQATALVFAVVEADGPLVRIGEPLP